MANFRTVLFNGYQRADVDGYVEKLMEELSALQTEKDKIAEEKRRMEETFQEKLKRGAGGKVPDAEGAGTGQAADFGI